MPNTKSAIKAMRQSRRRQLVNAKIRTNVKQALKDIRKLIKAGKKAEATEALKKAMSVLDKAVKKGIIHKNNSSRKKSRLAKALAK